MEFRDPGMVISDFISLERSPPKSSEEAPIFW